MELKINPWTIESDDCSPEIKDFRESIFSQGNGYMGMRGFAPEDRKGNTYSRTMFISGFYEQIRCGITDIVNQPDVTSTKLLINGTDAAELPKQDFNQTLDMQDGSLLWTYTVKGNDGHKTNVVIKRFLSMARRHIAALRFEITPLDHDGIIAIETGIDDAVENLPISDNQLDCNTETARIWGSTETTAHGVYIETAYSKRATAIEYRITGKPMAQVKQGETLTIDKFAAIYCYRDGSDLRKSARSEADKALATGFDKLLAENRRAWDKIWETADIELDIPKTGAAKMSAEELQGAVRYNICCGAA